MSMCLFRVSPAGLDQYLVCSGEIIVYLEVPILYDISECEFSYNGQFHASRLLGMAMLLNDKIYHSVRVSQTGWPFRVRFLNTKIHSPICIDINLQNCPMNPELHVTLSSPVTTTHSPIQAFLPNILY